MARKTNKTDHVLGLLAGKNEETVSSEEKNKKTAEKKTDSGSVAGSNVHVVAKKEEDDAIADTVKHLLEEELEAEEGGEPVLPEAIIDETEEAQAMEEAKEEARRMAEEEALKVEEELKKAEEARKAAEEELKRAEEVRKAAEEELKKAEEEAFKRAEEEALRAAEELEKEKAAKDEYVFLNVMETLVREKVDTYMNQFGTCKCSRCKADITALALTSLPSKYVVVSRNAATPLMNFYSQRFAGAITVEITKACTKVKEHPHHGRE